MKTENLVVIAGHLELVARAWFQRLLENEDRTPHALLARVAGPPGVVVGVLETLQRSASVVPVRNHGLDRDPQGRLARSQPAHLDLPEEEVVAVLGRGHLHQQGLDAFRSEIGLDDLGQLARLAVFTEAGTREPVVVRHDGKLFAVPNVGVAAIVPDLGGFEQLPLR